MNASIYDNLWGNLDLKVQVVPEEETFDQAISAEVEEILAFGEYKGWDFVYLGRAPYPTRIIRLDHWKLIPGDRDRTDLPVRARRRLKYLNEAGFDFYGFVIAHEIKDKPQSTPRSETASHALVSSGFKAREFGQGALEVGKKTLPGAIGGLAIVGGVVASLAVATITATLSGMALVDPVLIGVTHDNSWVELYRWDE